MQWAGKRVLVTGATGLIGGPLCKMLLARGAKVTGYDLNSVGTLPAHGIKGEFPVIVGNIIDLSEVEKAMEHQEIVIHLAAVSGVETSRLLKYAAWEINVRGTYTVMEACRRNAGIKAVVAASSNHVYGAQRVYPTNESAPMNQLDTYSATKIAADAAARSYGHNYGLPVAVVRNTNCYGVGDPHHDHIIPSTIQAVHGGQPPVIKSDGKRRKAFLYVDDVAEAYLDIAEWVHGGGQPGEAFNVSGESITVLGLVERIIQVLGSDLEPQILNEPNDQHDEFLDCHKVMTYTGWKPKTSLEDGVRKTAQWMWTERKRRAGVA